MAKKKDTTELQALHRQVQEMQEELQGVVSQERISTTLRENYMPYAMSVIVSRALPEIDGFKPSHRKLLYTMYRMGLLRGDRTKSANIVGQTMRLHPHGDQAIYETMVRLTTGNESLLHPYVDSKGNMGKQYSRDMQYAAPRYTEARLANIAEEIFKEINQDTVDFVPNYDGSTEEPVLLPTRFPAILVNSNQGIAVGMANNIPSFNLNEVCDATIEYLRKPSSNPIDLMPAPDFAGGGQLLYNPEKMAEIYDTGRGTFRLRAKYRVLPKERMIEIYEIPNTSTVEGIIDDISKLVREDKLKDITDIRDETDLNGLRLTIDYRRNADPEQLMMKLFRSTGLENRFACNFTMLIKGRPLLMSVKDIIIAWVDFRRESVVRATNHRIREIDEKLHLLYALEKILLDIDEAIRIVRQTEKEADVVANLSKHFEIDEIQANYIAEIRLRQLNREHILNRTQEIEALENERADLADLTENPKRVSNLIVSQLREIQKKYGRERLTELVDEDDVPEITREDLIEDFNLKLFLTHDGYLKKLALTSLRSAGELRTKENDYIIQSVEATNRAELLLFSSKAALYKIPVAEIDLDRPSDWGTYLHNLIDLEAGEKILYLVVVSEGEEYSGEMVFAYEDGRVSRVDLMQYETVQKRRKLVNVCNPRAPLVGLHYLSAEELAEMNQAEVAEDLICDFVLTTSQDRAIVFDFQLVEKKVSRNNQGDRVARLRKGHHATAFYRLKDVAIEDVSRYRARKLPSSGVSITDPSITGDQPLLIEWL